MFWFTANPQEWNTNLSEALMDNYMCAYGVTCNMREYTQMSRKLFLYEAAING